MDYTKHEVIPCERCGRSIECKANSFTKCQCTEARLNLNQTQYISEKFAGCVCVICLVELKEEYEASLRQAGVAKC